MAELLLINPRRRRRTASTKARRRNPSPAQRRARAAFAAAARARSAASRESNPARRRRRRRANPATASSRRRHTVRYANPARRSRRRRSNPIALGSASSYIAMIKDGLIGGAGALAVDVAIGYISPYLPATLQRTPGQISIGDGVKALITVVLGQVLNRPTRGLSVKAARGALTVQAHGLLAQLLPSTVTLGYAVPGQVVNANNRIGPNRRALSRYVAPGTTPLLNRYTAPGVSPLLSGVGRVSARERESMIR